MPALLGRVSSMQVIVTLDSEGVILDLHGRSCVIQTLAHKDDVNSCAINACCEHFNHTCIKLFGSTFPFDRRVLTHAFNAFPGGKDAPSECIFGAREFVLKIDPQHDHRVVHWFRDQASIRDTERIGGDVRG